MKLQAIKPWKFAAISMLLLASTIQLSAQKEFVRNAKPAVKIALESYSFSKLLNDYNKDSQKGLSIDQLLEFAASQNFDAISITGYFFPGYPAVPTDDYIFQTKRKAFQLGLDICGTGVRNDFANPDPTKRAADVKHVKEWIDVAVKLGAPVLKIFSGNIPAGYENKWDEVAKYMAASIKECTDYAEKRGVMIGVQNHGDFLKTADETIKLVKMVNSKWFGVIVDSGYFITDNPYEDMAKVMPYAINFLLKESPVPGGSAVKIDLIKVKNLLKESGFRGYAVLETLSSKGPGKNGGSSKEKAPAYNPYEVVPVFKDAVIKIIITENRN